tara:strand:+ start:2020 stop:2295 length:276 start_codon:yes stop_codon:yes gene_type:complete
MALKDKQSQFDLVNGENPVGNMANQTGDPNFNTLQGTSNSPFSSEDHMITLLDQAVNSSNSGQVYTPAPNSSDFQDLNGVTPSKYTDNLPT